MNEYVVIFTTEVRSYKKTTEEIINALTAAGIKKYLQTGSSFMLEDASVFRMPGTIMIREFLIKDGSHERIAFLRLSCKYVIAIKKWNIKGEVYNGEIF